MNWRDKASCRTAPRTADFIPGPRDLNTLRGLAQEWCADCPALQACATYADRYRTVGLWAGVWRTRQAGSGAYRATPLIPEAPVPQLGRRTKGAA